MRDGLSALLDELQYFLGIDRVLDLRLEGGETKLGLFAHPLLHRLFLSFPLFRFLAGRLLLLISVHSFK